MFREDVTRVRICVSPVDLQTPNDEDIDEALSPFDLKLFEFERPPPESAESTSYIEVLTLSPLQSCLLKVTARSRLDVLLQVRWIIIIIVICSVAALVIVVLVVVKVIHRRR